jgi:CBS domain-containing protein
MIIENIYRFDLYLDICARLMLEKEISSVVVVDNDGVLKGIITIQIQR